jgi:hypothetical protein
MPGAGSESWQRNAWALALIVFDGGLAWLAALLLMLVARDLITRHP